MDTPLFENEMINLRDHEIVPESVPQNETPRQFVLRMTGRDFPGLTYDGRDWTWQELKDAGALSIIERIIQVASLHHVRVCPRPGLS